MKKWLIAGVVLLLVVGSFFAVRTNNQVREDLPQPAPWPTPTSVINYSTPESSVFTFMCELTNQYKPDTFYTACADGYAGIRKIHWSSWGAKGATGSGYRFGNPCNPDCASDSVQDYEKVFLKLDTPIQMGKSVYLTVLHSTMADANGRLPADPLWSDWDLGYDFRMMLNWGQ